MSALRVDVSENVAIAEICRGPNNFLNKGAIEELVLCANQLVAEKRCRAMVICSEGKHFSAGADFSSAWSAGDRVAGVARFYSEALKLFQIGVPVIAAVQGAAIGGGLGLACVADFRVGGPSARFQANFARLGFHQGFGLSVTLPDIVGRQRAAEMLYTSRPVLLEEALSMGLVDRIAEEGEERAVALQWAEEIATQAPLAVQSIKQTLRKDLIDRVKEVLPRELREQTRLWATQDSVRGIQSSLARQDPVFDWE